MIDFIADLVANHQIEVATIIVALFWRSPVDSKIIKSILGLIRTVIDKILKK